MQISKSMHCLSYALTLYVYILIYYKNITYICCIIYIYIVYTTITGGAERLKNTLRQLAEWSDSRIPLPQLAEGPPVSRGSGGACWAPPALRGGLGGVTPPRHPFFHIFRHFFLYFSICFFACEMCRRRFSFAANAFLACDVAADALFW